MPSLSASKLASLFVAAAILAGVSRARAGESAEICASAAEDAQSLRSQGHLVEARRKLAVCAAEACPRVVKDHCARWLGEVDKATPTLVVRAHDARGVDVTGAKVFLDGKEIWASITGRASPADPGPHTLRVVAASGASSEQPIVVAEGEKDRAIVVTINAKLLPDGTNDASAVPPPATTPIEPPPRDASPSRVTVPFVVSAAIGVVALGVFIPLEVAGQNEYSSLKNGCEATKAGSCAASDVDSAHAKLYGAGAALGVSIVAFGVAAIVFATHTTSSTRAREAKALLAPRAAPPSFDLLRF